DLISDGATFMRVELEFLADGDTWRVSRLVPSGTYPPAAHKLVCVEDGTTVNGRRDVDAHVQRLVGLDRDAFLRSVVLPQGRFAELLQATGRERTAILKNVFRVDELDRARA